jgi:hypothetical protein
MILLHDGRSLRRLHYGTTCTTSTGTQIVESSALAIRTRLATTRFIFQSIFLPSRWMIDSFMILRDADVDGRPSSQPPDHRKLGIDQQKYHINKAAAWELKRTVLPYQVQYK